MTAVVQAITSVRAHVLAARQDGKQIGFVPTMGALHAGHLSLVEQARQSCEYIVMSIFVNPTQFGPNEDLARYPRPFENDLKLCQEAGVDLLFHPGVEIMYPPGASTFVEVGGVSELFEGSHRPGHFRGVATVVLKLFNIVQPDRAFFGQKDFQQQMIIRKMCRELDLPVDIITCPTMREPDGLAMSSRNVYLSPEERSRSLILSKTLFETRDRLLAGEQDLKRLKEEMSQRLSPTEGIELDYFAIADAETLQSVSEPVPRIVVLVAARVGNTRLIDNVMVEQIAHASPLQ